MQHLPCNRHSTYNGNKNIRNTFFIAGSARIIISPVPFLAAVFPTVNTYFFIYPSKPTSIWYFLAPGYKFLLSHRSCITNRLRRRLCALTKLLDTKLDAVFGYWQIILLHRFITWRAQRNMFTATLLQFRSSSPWTSTTVKGCRSLISFVHLN